MMIINCFLISWFITYFIPLQDFLENKTEYLLEKYTNKYLHILINNVNSILSCFKCLSLWFTLLMTFNPIYAILNSFLAYTYIKIIDRK